VPSELSQSRRYSAGVGLFKRAEQAPPDGVHGLDHRALVDLRKAGADLSRPRHFRRYLLVGDRSTGDVVAERCRGLVDGVVSVDRERRHGEGGDWVVRVESTEVLDLGRVTHERWLLENLASENGVEYDGWEGGIEPLRADRF